MRNYAELEALAQAGTDMEVCRRMGATHAAYGWSRTPLGHWSQEAKAAYNQGSNSNQQEGGLNQ